MTQVLKAAPGQTVEYVLIRRGQVVDRLILNSTEFPCPAARVHELWDQYLEPNDAVFVRVFPKLERTN